jgi:hypothetical protein
MRNAAALPATSPAAQQQQKLRCLYQKCSQAFGIVTQIFQIRGGSGIHGHKPRRMRSSWRPQQGYSGWLWLWLTVQGCGGSLRRRGDSWRAAQWLRGVHLRQWLRGVH